MKIFVDVTIPDVLTSFFTQEVKEKLAKTGEVVYNTGESPLSGKELANALKGVDVLITGWNHPTITKDDLGDVKLIVHTGGSVGGIIDLSVYDTDVRVLSGNRYYAESVAEGTLSYMLMALRKMGEYSSALKNNGEWLQPRNEGLLDKTIGIVSLGQISRHLIPMLKVFRTKIKVYSTTPDQEEAKALGFEYAELDEIFSTCDIVTVHTAKCPETDNMINDRHFKLLKDGALFINTSRGSVIDENSLIENLKENRFTAVLDVYQTEPLPSSSELRNLENVILFPHHGGPTFDRRKYITLLLIDDIVRFFNGQDTENTIPREVAEKMTVIK